MQQDEILIEPVESLKAQNDDLRKRLDAKPKPWFGIAQMWSDFWLSISKMWSSFWTSNGGPVVLGILGVICTITVCITYYNVAEFNRPPGSIPIPTGQYAFTVNTSNNCYFIYERLSNGDKAYKSPCIKERKDAIKALEETKAVHGIVGK